MRLGFRLLKGLSQSDANVIVATRGSRPFTLMDDFFHRTGASNAVAACLSRGDVFRSLQLNRRESLWQSLPDPDPGPLFAGVNDEEPQAPLPQMTSVQETFADYRSSGMTLRDHPLSFIRSDLDKCGVSVAASLTDESKKDRRCRVAGLVLIRQRPSTAKGITFMTLEDETGTANLVVHVNTWERFRKIARGATAMIAHGILQQQHGTVHLVVDRMEDLTSLLGEVGNKSRDFH
ncbi:MAG: error-prone polymerase, DnaE-like protein [Schlesneria sp.]|nr:error-prone polymerase, DnaE-like protein [Schlesneria sp.]